MKVALIGNMNNNNFALMRYFRDLGIDAHLLLFSNDGEDSLTHFTPEADSWNINNWAPYIHRMNIPNYEFSIVGAIESIFLWSMPFAFAKSTLKRLFGKKNSGWRAPDLTELKNAFNGYDYYIGSGIAPAIFEKMGWRLNLFYPYSIGIEFFSSQEFILKLNSKNLFTRTSAKEVKALQAKGILNAFVSLECGSSHEAYKSLGINAKPILIPMVYLEEHNSIDQDELSYLNALNIKPLFSELIFFHSARLFWIKPFGYTEKMWKLENKNNNWFIRAFARFLKIRPQIKATLWIVEYGPDINATKKLCFDLGLNERIIWLPKMDRKNLLRIHKNSTVSIGEFYSSPQTVWGGTGWEALATGTPLIQGFNFPKGEFNKIFGYPPPPIFPVSTEDHILEHLLFISDHQEKVSLIGKKSKEWFDAYNGMELAKQWLDILKNSSELNRS